MCRSEVQEMQGHYKGDLIIYHSISACFSKYSSPLSLICHFNLLLLHRHYKSSPCIPSREKFQQALGLDCWCTSSQGVVGQITLGLVNYISTLLYCSVLSMDFSLACCQLLFMRACMAALGGSGSKDVWPYRL